MKKQLLAAAALLGGALLSTPATAIINAPVPTDNYITIGGFDWAWAAPCSPVQPSCGVVDFSYQSTQGWRLPTAAEFLAGPTAASFGPSNSFKCAAAWFSTAHTHCDYNDGVNLHIYGHPGNVSPNASTLETWVIRNNEAIPEPTSWALMLSGFGLAGWALRQRRGTLVAYA